LFLGCSTCFERYVCLSSGASKPYYSFWYYSRISLPGGIMGMLELTKSQFQNSHDTMIPLWTTDRSVSEISICQHTTFTHREPCPHRVSNSLLQKFLECEIYPSSSETLELKHNLRQLSNAVHSKTHQKLLELTFNQFQHSHDTSRQRHTCVIPEAVIQFRCS
jgi:hypothetical protein